MEEKIMNEREGKKEKEAQSREVVGEEAEAERDPSQRDIEKQK